MTVEYVSWKAGDPKIKPAPQKIKPKVWTQLDFGAQDSIVPKNSGIANWAFYLNVATAGGAKDMKIRFTRDIGTKDADFTGQRMLDLALDNIHSGTWFFKANKGQPVGLEVYHAGTSDMTIITREFKMWIP
jgi:hypothetical protein